MGKRKKQVVGHAYYMGIHVVLCRLGLDALLEWRAADKVVWRGFAKNNRQIKINKPDLFGGELKEGGLQGTLDVMMGAPTQGVLPALQSMLGGLVPAFRGVTSLFYDGLVCTMAPYVKPWEFLGRRVLNDWLNDECWYPEKAEIRMLGAQSAAIYITVDCSGSMDTITSNGRSRFANMKTALTAALDYIRDDIVSAGGSVDVMVVGFGTEPDIRTSIMRRNCTAADISTIQAWINGLSTGLWTYFPAGLLDLADFFAGAPEGARQVTMFITDGAPTTSDSSMLPIYIANAAAGVVEAAGSPPVHGINIDEEDTTYTAIVDNTDDDVPVVSGGDPTALLDILMSILGGLTAMNPAHMLMQAYTDPRCMRGLPMMRMDDESFRRAADTLHAEGLGLCLGWASDKVSLADFAQIVLDHIGGYIYQHRRTGLITLKLARADYVKDDLPLFTPDSGLLAITEDESSSSTTGINEVIVEYTDPVAHEDKAVRVKNLGAIAAAEGITNSMTKDYRGLPTEALARRAAMRDLKASSGFLKKFEIRLDRRGHDIHPGDVFRISDPARGIIDMTMRAGETDYGTQTDGTIKVKCVQDVFGLPDTLIGDTEAGAHVPPDTTPRAVQYRRVMELPFRDLSGFVGNDEALALDPTAGYLYAIGARPSTLSLGFQVSHRVGAADWITDDEVGSFCMTATLDGPIGRTDTSITLNPLPAGMTLANITPNSAALIDDEIVRVDGIVLGGNSITIARGCADTIPAPHNNGARIFFYNDTGSAADTEYTSGVTVDAKLRTRTSSGFLALASSPTDMLTFAHRAARPYPPANVHINGSADWPDEISGDLALAWAHRDRAMQADQLIDTTAPGIGPEPDTTYALAIYEGTTSVLAHSASGITDTEYTWTPDTDGQYTMELWSERGGLESLQRHRHTFVRGSVLWEPLNLSTPPQILLDDAAVLTIVSGAASSWVSRSNSAYEFVQATTARRPTVFDTGLNGRRYLYFNGSTPSALAATTTAQRQLFSGVSQAWVFVVARPDSNDGPAGEDRPLFWAPIGASTTSRFALSVGGVGAANNRITGGRRLDSDGYSGIYSNVTHTPGEWEMLLALVDYAAGTITLHRNGAAPTTVASTWASGTGQTSNSTSQVGLMIGALASYRVGMTGGIASVVSGTSAPTAAETDKLFGWAAHHYALTDLLPAGHPYKTEAPRA